AGLCVRVVIASRRLRAKGPPRPFPPQSARRRRRSTQLTSTSTVSSHSFHCSAQATTPFGGGLPITLVEELLPRNLPALDGVQADLLQPAALVLGSVRHVEHEVHRELARR